MINLAINGGKKIRTKPFPSWKRFSNNYLKKSINDLLDTGVLSNYRGNWQPEFWGGKYVRDLEEQVKDKFDVKYALAVNSCTSALQITCGAVGITPGDEVIVTPWSMSCSATAPMVYGGIPIFCDIEENDFCIDPEKIEKLITDRTKAIIPVSLFGQAYDYELLNPIAKKYNLKVIEDAAQAIGAKDKNGYAGTHGDIGCYSFTQGKHLTAGEGGMIVTNDEELYMRCALIRNHAEAVVHGMGDKVNLFPEDIQSLYGFNMRMTEIQALIILSELDSLYKIVEQNISNADLIYHEIKDIPYIINPGKRDKDSYSHSYYVQPFIFDDIKAGVSRDRFVNAVKAELTGEESRPDRPMMGCGYIEPLYKFPVFDRTRRLPVVEDLWSNSFFLSLYHGLPLKNYDIRDIVNAFYKVHENREELK